MAKKTRLAAAIAACILCSMAAVVAAQEAAVPASGESDPVAATEAFLAKQTTDQKARSDAYFEGGYWIQLWEFLLGAAFAFLLLASRISAGLRDFAERITRRKPLQTMIYWLGYFLISTAVFFPWSLYTGFFREHKYGLSNQTFAGWLGDEMKGDLVGVIVGLIAMPILYGIFRKLTQTWWIWGSVVGVAILILLLLVGPVFIDPLFNEYKPLDKPAISEPILRMARMNMITVSDVMMFDASKQTKRVSANVSGFLGTERIALNDNLLNRCTLPEIEHVMAHEMGHYVMNHIYKGILYFSIVIVVGFAFVRWAFNWAVGKWGAAWKVSGIGDVAGMPLFFFIFSIFFFVLTPVNNTYIRVGEVEADVFALNLARQPDAAAEVALKLGEYRKLRPGPIEEFIFYDHPSGHTRILTAMRWKKESMQPIGEPAEPIAQPAASASTPQQ
ncbi:MAG: M48 family metallopeptidase [Acidobacteriota bacterium]